MSWPNLSDIETRVDEVEGRPVMTDYGFRRALVEYPSPMGGGIDMEIFSFGCFVEYVLEDDLLKPYIKVNAGYVIHGTRTVSVPGTEFQIDTDTWIWVEYKYGSGASIERGASAPASDNETLRAPLSFWTYDTDTETPILDRVHHVGIILIPSVRQQ